MALPTIADSVADALNLSDAEVTDLLNEAPFLASLPADESSDGVNHRYAKEQTAPVVGFRVENDGRDYDFGADTIVNVALKILDWSSKVDKAVADAWRKGGRDAYVRRNGIRHLRAAMFKYESQIINGIIGDDATGFTGLADALDELSDSMVLDGAGVSADAVTSVYAVRVGSDDMQAIFKGDGIADVSETTVVAGVGATTGELPMYYTPASSWLALQIGSAYSVARLANLDGTATLTDDMLYDLIDLFPSGRKPTQFVMNRQSLGQLRKSRTATSVTGTPAPYPTSVEGIPITSVESITNTESVIV